MGDGSTPGNGKTNPFGNGAGAPASSGGGGRDFSKEDRGNNAPKVGEFPDLNREGSPGELRYKRDALPGNPDVGAGSMGNSRKPFKLGK